MGREKIWWWCLRRRCWGSLLGVESMLLAGEKSPPYHLWKRTSTTANSVPLVTSVPAASCSVLYPWLWWEGGLCAHLMLAFQRLCFCVTCQGGPRAERESPPDGFLLDTSSSSLLRHLDFGSRSSSGWLLTSVAGRILKEHQSSAFWAFVLSSSPCESWCIVAADRGDGA